MPNSAVRIDGLQPLQVALHLAAKIAFNRDFVVRDRVNDFIQLLRRQILRAQVWIDIGLLEDALRRAQTDSVDVSERGFNAFVCWNFNSE